jgi:ribosomal protein S6--L-glutamate ligase
MRIVILSRNASLYSTSRLALAARARGHQVAIVDPLELHLVVAESKPALIYGSEPFRKADVVIPRIGTSINSYGLTVVRQFDLMGVPVLNPAVSIARCRDKLRALQLLTAKKIAVPITVCARSPAAVTSALKIVGGCPAIVKLQQGSQGIGTMIAETPQAVMSLLETFWAMGQDIILQEYIRESKGRDVRAVVVGRRVVAAMRRTARKGEFRSNLHRGGMAVGIQLDPAYRTTAIKAVRLMSLEVAGVDMVETKTGPKILEINASPGLEGIERASGVDVAGAVIDYAERFVVKRKGQGRRQAVSRMSAVVDDERTLTRRRGVS